MSDKDGLDRHTAVENFFRGLDQTAASAAGDDKVVPFNKPSHPEDGDDAAGTESDRQELAKKSDPLPETPQERYRPHAAFLNRLQTEQRTFYCVFADCTFRGFPYAHYDGIRLVRVDSPGGGFELVVRFRGSVTEEVRIRGQTLTLRFIARCVGMGIMPWIWELPAGRKVKDGESVVTSIGISVINAATGEVLGGG